jgi:hypothetical protein
MFIQLIFYLRIRTLIVIILLIDFSRLSSTSSSLPQNSCTSWVNYLRNLEMILTLKYSCHFLSFVHSPTDKDCLSIIKSYYILPLSVLSEPVFHSAGQCRHCRTYELFLLCLISCSSLGSNFLSYTRFIYGPIFDSYYPVNDAWNEVTLFLFHPTFS